MAEEDNLHLTDHWPVAPGHELPQDEWDAVKAYADEWSGRSMAALASPSIPKITSVTYPGKGGKKDSGKRTKKVQLWIVHTAECPLQAGYAVSLSRWGADSSVQASWNAMSDPSTLCHFVPYQLVAWHATYSNPISVGVEQSGYAAFPLSTWQTPEGKAAIDACAYAFVEAGIPKEAVRRLSDTEARAARDGNKSIEGLCGHGQVQPETRTDPGKGYDWDYLIERIKYHHPDFATPEEELMPNSPSELTKAQRDEWADFIYESVMRRDGFAAATVPTETNPEWFVERILTDMAQRVLRSEAREKAQTAAIEALAEALKNGMDPAAATALVEEKVDAVLAEVKAEVKLTRDSSV